MAGQQGQQAAPGELMELAARSPTSDVFGKLIATIPPVGIDPETLVELHRMAAANHMTLSEFVRGVLRVKAWGLDHVVNVMAQRERQAFGNPSEIHSGGEA